MPFAPPRDLAVTIDFTRFITPCGRAKSRTDRVQFPEVLAIALAQGAFTLPSQ